MKYLIDTSILIEIEKNNKDVIKQLSDIPFLLENNLNISLFSYCEFYFGLIKKNKKNKHSYLQRLNKYNVYDPNLSTAALFSELLFSLRERGKLIQHFDIFIAATAIENNFTVITKDKLFLNIREVRTILIK
tara:strand:- start:23107 stop:23502 length:396 start_codon:yes stop_codon:yes gene_type:complete